MKERDCLPILSEALNTMQRDLSRPIMLVGFQEQGNLGIGYLAATLRRNGYTVQVFDFQADPTQILQAAIATDPLLIGFSLIFQFYVLRFATVIRFLRANGVNCHFTMGGHFPSLSHAHTLELVPELDSVVRFEGELTLLELAERLNSGQDWHNVQGIAYREQGQIITTTLRPLIHDLDSLPYPDRNFQPDTVLGHAAMPLLASRGCARTCSFCSIHTFYRAAPGKVVRTRKPANVVQEMLRLHEDRGITIFLFQDDDFPLFGPVWRRWAAEFVEELHRSGLPERAIWKMNCRADAVEPELLRSMREAGLYLVYMGLESGSEEGLRTLHKQITVQQNIRAVDILKALDLMFEFGFMLFDPSSTFESVRDNIAFLRRIVGDGGAAATFCRMLPYDGTPIKEELARSGRLKGDVCDPNYDFLDPRLDAFYHDLRTIVDLTGWIHGYRALSPQLNWAWNEVAIMQRLFPGLESLPDYREQLRDVTKASNETLFHVIEDLSYAFSEGRSHNCSAAILKEQAEAYLDRLHHVRNSFVYHNQSLLIDALGGSALAGAST